jgi:hypothetical protein
MGGDIIVNCHSDFGNSFLFFVDLGHLGNISERKLKSL